MIDYRVAPNQSAELVRLYVITQGRDLSGGEQLPLTALIAAATEQRRVPPHLAPEEQRLLQLCRGGCLSVAEMAGHTQLPLGVVRVFLASLLKSGCISIRQPGTGLAGASAQTIRNVLDGLEAKFG